MTGFTTSDMTIDGVRVQVLQAGSGDPLVYFHGAGATRGFGELLPLARNRRLIVPIHPGFGGSDDDPLCDTVMDYVLHYARLLDRLDLTGPIDLVGHSLGGWMAALFAVLNGHRVRRLVLACPAGLRVPDHPATDLFVIPPEQLLSWLVSSPDLLAELAKAPPDNEATIARYRELTTLARLIWTRNSEPKLDRWLNRVAMPTLILWGQQDRVLPVQQARHWADRLAGEPEIETFDGAGHLLFAERPAAVARVEAFFGNKQAA